MKTTRVGDILVLMPEQDITFDNSKTVREKMKAAVSPNDRQVIVDLEKVSMMDSSGLGVMVSMHKLLTERQGVLKLASPQEKVHKVISITRFDRLVEVYQTVDKTINSF